MSWIDWSLLERHSETFRFARNMFALRRAHSVLRREAFYTDDDIRWFSPNGNSPDWFDVRQKCPACLILAQDGPDLYLMLNADTVPITFILPASPRPWRLAADTAQASPRDCCAPGEETTLINPMSYGVESHSSVVLVAR